MSALTLALIARIPAPGIAAFQDYEAKVLPLLAEHQGSLQRRLRSDDGTSEIHIVRFASQIAFESFRSDPRRAAAAHLLVASGAVTEVIAMHDVTVGP